MQMDFYTCNTPVKIRLDSAGAVDSSYKIQFDLVGNVGYSP